MKNETPLQKLNSLRKIAVFGQNRVTKISEGAGIVIFGLGRDAVSFYPLGNVRILNETIDFLYKNEISIFNNFSRKNFQNKLIDLFRKVNKEDRDFKIKDWEEFKSSLNNIPQESFRIFAPIYGVKMDTEMISLGEFTIYHPDYLKETLHNEYPKIIKLINQHIKFDHNYKISVDIRAKDTEKGYELAFKLFSSFENVANFVMATFHKTKRIGIFNYLKFINFESFILSERKLNKSSVTLEHFEEVKIDEFQALHIESARNSIWKLITSERNEIEQRILNSIEWVGKALIEQDDTKALLQYIIAIEAVLQYDEGKFIVPSIVSQLSDTIAFLLGETSKDRIYYSNEVKNLYKIRSSITHSGKGNINSLTLHTAHIFCYKIVMKLISADPFNKFKSKKELYEYLHNLKYG